MTIRELAKHAKVSRTTVSRALNNAPDVSEETRDRIQRLARELGYKANPMITALMSSVRMQRVKKSRSVLAIVPPPFQKIKWGTGHYSNTLYRRGVEKRAKRLGFVVEDFMVADFANSYERLTQVLYSRGIQAVLIPSIDSNEYPAEFDYGLDWNKFFVAGIGYSLSKTMDVDLAVMSHYSSTLVALEKILERGYRRIGFGVRKRINKRTQERWLAAYLIFQKNHPELPTIPYFEFEFGESAGADFDQWFRTHKPDAILGERYFMQLLGNCGIRTPEDVGFALLDLLPGSPDSKGIAGMDQRFESVGSAAVGMLAGKINRGDRGLASEPHVLKIRGKWIDGTSLPSRDE